MKKSISLTGNESGHVEQKKTYSSITPSGDEKRKKGQGDSRRGKERSARVWKKETAEQSRLDMISMECLLTLIHGPGPTDKWLNSSAVKARGFLWACVSLCTFSWREGSSQLTDTELTMKHTKRSPLLYKRSSPQSRGALRQRLIWLHHTHTNSTHECCACRAQQAYTYM